MDRISTATKAVDLFGAGKHGFKDGNLGLGIAPTDFNAAWFNDIQEELIGIIESAGLTPTAGTRTQVSQAIAAMIAAGSSNDYKSSVRAATTANIANLAGGAPNTLDNVALAANDRILVKDETTASLNGLYVITTLGTGANGTWTRATDADQAGELTSGAVVSVEEGTTNADTQWTLTTDGTITIGTTALLFERKNGEQLGLSVLTATGNFTTPANITTSTVFAITLVGGGAGGGGTNGANATGGGGGAGGAVTFNVSGLSRNTPYSVVIGAAGGGGSSAGGDGGTGGTTQITIGGTVYSVTGGVAGVGTTTSTVNINSAQGSPSASILALPNERFSQSNSNPGFSNSPTYAGVTGASLPWGSGGIGGRTGAGPGGTTGYGAGGGGAVGATMGGSNGAPGLFIAKWVA